MAAKEMRFVVRLLKAAVALVSRWLEGFFAGDRDRHLPAVLLLDLETAGAEVLEFGWAVKSRPCGKLGVGK